MSNSYLFGYPSSHPKLLIGGRLSQLDNVLPHFVLRNGGPLHVLVTHPSQIADQTIDDSLLRVAAKEVSNWTIPISFFWLTFNSMRAARRALVLTRYLTYVVFATFVGRKISRWMLRAWLANAVKQKMIAVADPLFVLQENSIESICAKDFKNVVLIPHFVFPGEGTVEDYKLELSGIRAVAAAERFVATKFVAVYPFLVRPERQRLPENLSFLPPENPRHTQKWLDTVISSASSGELRPELPPIAFFSRQVVGKRGDLKHERLTPSAKDEILREIYEFSKANKRVLIIRRHPAENSKIPLPEGEKNFLWVESNRHPLDILYHCELAVSTVSSLGADASWLGVPAVSFLKLANSELFLKWPKNSNGVHLFTANSIVGMESACSSLDHLMNVLAHRDQVVDHQRTSYEKYFFGLGC